MAFIELLQQVPWFLYLVTGVFSLLVGSFLNVVIYRLPIMMVRAWKHEAAEVLALPEEPGLSTQQADAPEQQEQQAFTLATPRSRCPHCGHPISAIENIPVISYLVLGGRCSECKTRIPLRYPLVELLTAALSLVVISQFGASWQGLAALLLTWVLIAASFIDIDRQWLPDNITLPWLWVGLFLSLFGVFTVPVDAIIGALAGYLSLWLVYQGFKLATKKEGMGYGDFKLLAMLGAWLGWKVLPLIILLSSAVGAVIGGALMLIYRRGRNVPIPYGPYLAIAGWIALLWGDFLIDSWLHWMQP